MSQQTRDRVLAAADALGYRIPRDADAPAVVAVLARFPSQWYFAQAVTALERRLGSRLIALLNMSRPDRRRQFFDQILPPGHVDGVIVVSTSFEAEESRALDQAAVPVVVVGGHVPGRPTVGIDEEAAARTATEHLIGLGHRDIAMLSFDPRDPVGHETTSARTRGFRAALAANGLAYEPDWVIAAEGSRMAGGFAAAERLLSRPRLPSAVFAMSDELAIGALSAVRRAGLQVPGRLSVVGLDDHEMAEYVDLTTVRQPVEALAEVAADLMHELLDHSPGPHLGPNAGPGLDIRLDTRLVVRGTTGPPGGPSSDGYS